MDIRQITYKFRLYGINFLTPEKEYTLIDPIRTTEV